MPDDFRDIVVVPARTLGEIAEFRRLCEEYAAALPFIAVSLLHQGFESEMKGLPGKYAPPTGEILLAFRRDSGGADAAPMGEAERRAVGCVAVRPLDEPGVCEMKRMYISPAARGVGVGHRLGRAVVEAAREAGYRVMRLDTDKSMLAAMTVYRRLGFRECPPYNTDPCPNTLWFELNLRSE